MMPVISRNWDHPFDLFCRELDHVLTAPGPQNRSSSFPVDIRDEAGTIIIEAELPGFSKEQIAVSTEDDVLRIVADRAQRQGDGEGKQPPPAFLRERHLAKMSRSFRVPRSVDASGVEARLANGVLTLRLPKCEQVKPRRIDVK